MKTFILSLSVLILLLSCSKTQENIGKTEITKWQYGKNAAISITFDDASINQFRQALPILDTLGFDGTFFINTVDIPHTQFLPKFFGRPIQEIIKETSKIPTNQSNLFERASALRFINIENSIEKHNSAGSLYETGKTEEAFKVIDDAYAIARKQHAGEKPPRLLKGNVITWPEIKVFAERGHEFGNHTISHPRLSVLDEPNLLYEIEKCKEEILNQLGPKHTFSAECPFGTENERVMEYALKIHPALRNRMPEPFLGELNRSSKLTPASSDKEYVQWQRGPLAKTTLEEMKAWVDTLMTHDNVWLVLTFHGVDGIGWEAKPHEDLKAYFEYMKGYESKLWVATFQDATKYMRERMNAKVNVKQTEDKIVLTLGHSLDKTLYDHSLTLKTAVPADWKEVTIKQGSQEVQVSTSSDEKGTFVIYQAMPNKEDIEITHK